ncbi:hypothetical protein [Kitasatospora sp. NBC_01302]|uniref:hypothetical protein n=1 Tax=Kitasatospora sp. NBC_01302 TaxID=2903575 RepID=UPI002E0D5C7F|nr:hypothetical protein OG294_14405 [Kitasatospora sp. NBC_01302]
MTTADACAREAAWLSTTGDTLPSLLSATGGPWDVIQAYLPRTPTQQRTQIYVLRRRLVTARFAQQRRMATHHFQLSLVWPVGATASGPQIAELEQTALDSAVALLVTRIEGLVNDKSHGNRFLSVAEAPNGSTIDVEYDDPAQGVANGFFAATVTYTADDADYTN